MKMNVKTEYEENYICQERCLVSSLWKQSQAESSLNILSLDKYTNKLIADYDAAYQVKSILDIYK